MGQGTSGNVDVEQGRITEFVVNQCAVTVARCYRLDRCVGNWHVRKFV